MTPSQKRWAIFSLLIATIGIAMSAYLTYEHYQVLKIGYTGKSFCNINSYLNCDLVLSSRYASLGSIPLAGLGFLFYLYVTGALLYALWTDRAPEAYLGLPYLLSMGSCLLSLGLAWISLYQLQSFCIFCTSLYLVSFALFVFLKKTLAQPLGDTMGLFHRIPWKPALIYFATIFVIGSGLFDLSHRQFARELSPELKERYLISFKNQPQVSFDVSGRPFWGNPEAKVTIVEFSDFECPYCKVAAFNLKPALTDYKEKVKLVFMNYPLDQACNKTLEREMHKQACTTASAAYCAGQQGKFWEYHDLAFDRQPKFSESSLENIAKKLKLDLATFKTCLGATTTQQFLAADIEQGNQAKLQGTPSVFVNGRPFPDWRSKDLFQAVVEKELSSK